MFGIIAAGQLVQTDFQLVGENQFLTKVAAKADVINHIVVFLTGTMPFPDGMGALVYYSLPDPVSPPAWHLIGYISNDKPSAIFKVSGLKISQRHFNTDGTPFMFGMGSVCVEAQIGIQVDSLASIQQQCPNLPSNPDGVTPPVLVQFSQKMLESLINYTMSFALTQGQMTPNPTETYVPLSSLQTWYANFERRLLQNPDFWKD